MKAIEFEQQTVVLAKDQPEYNNLPVHITNDAERQMISCHELTDEELKIINETKKMWHGQCTFGKHYHPTWLSVQNPFIGEQPSTKTIEYKTISDVASCYGQILFFQWRLKDNDEWNTGKGKVNARLLLDMEKGLIRNVKSKPE